MPSTLMSHQATLCGIWQWERLEMTGTTRTIPGREGGLRERVITKIAGKTRTLGGMARGHCSALRTRSQVLWVFAHLQASTSFIKRECDQLYRCICIIHARRKQRVCVGVSWCTCHFSHFWGGKTRLFTTEFRVIFRPPDADIVC